MVYVTAFIFTLTELQSDESKELICVSLFLFFGISVLLIFTFNRNSRLIAWALTILILTIVLLYDYFKVAGKR
jgi:hypothetical protein